MPSSSNNKKLKSFYSCDIFFFFFFSFFFRPTFTSCGKENKKQNEVRVSLSLSKYNADTNQKKKQAKKKKLFSSFRLLSSRPRRTNEPASIPVDLKSHRPPGREEPEKKFFSRQRRRRQQSERKKNFNASELSFFSLSPLVPCQNLSLFHFRSSITSPAMCRGEEQRKKKTTARQQ